MQKEERMKVGCIGLGNLGRAIAARLRSSGYDLTVWNRTTDKAVTFGGTVAKNPSMLISAVDVVMINLFDSEAVKAVLTGADGLLQGDCNGKIVIDTTTNHFEAVRHFHELVSGQSGEYLEAPVLGSVVPASKGALTVLVSGRQEAYRAAKPILEKIGSNIFYLEQVGLATRMKLINNLVLGSLMATLAEALVLAEEAGLTREQAIDVLSSGAGNSLLLNAKREKLLSGDYSPHFSSSLMYKDLHFLQDLARCMRRPVFMASTAKELFGLTIKKEKSADDFSVITQVLKGL